MALVNTDAIVLRSYNLAEADRIVVCLTRSAGLVRAVAKGARKMKSRFGAALEPFTFINLSFYERENRELVTVSRAEIVKSNFELASQLEVGEVLGYMAELIGEFAPPHEANEKLFRMITACVEALGGAPDSAKSILRYFEIWLLRLAGSFPDMRECSICGTRPEAQENLYLEHEGTVRCFGCSRGIGTALPPEVRQIIVSSHRLGPSEFAASHEGRGIDGSLAELTHRLIVRALDRRPRTMMTPAVS
jgi:DNA repair protein RecO (recombination protein O)